MTARRLLGAVVWVVGLLWLPAPALTSPVVPAGGPAWHVVRPGDTLWAIARQHDVAPAAVARANRLADPHRLRIGAWLVIPGATRSRGDAVPGRRLRTSMMAWPSRGVVTSRFGFRGRRHHHGIDIAAPVGAPITAARDGIVRFAGWRGGYGRLVILDHGGGLTTWYGHASKVLVRTGQRVSRGEVIALVGTSGNVTGPNVHFEVRQGTAPLDPWPFLAGRAR